VLTLCLGGPMDGILVTGDRPQFEAVEQVPLPTAFVYDNEPVPCPPKHVYRRERFHFDDAWMWVYIHEWMSERQACLELFGTWPALNT